jgi:cell division protein FtsQ
VNRGSGLTTRDRTDRQGPRTRERRRRDGRAETPVSRRRGVTAPRATGPVTPLPSRGGSVRSARRRPLVWLAGLLAVAALGAFLWAGPLLSVRTVRVDGAASLPAAQVQEAAGVAEGTPLLQVDVDAAAARVARLPQVADVQVTRGWPSTVVITVVERTPLAVVEEAGRRTLVDAEGVLFDTVTGEPPAGVVPLQVAAPGPGDPATMAGLAAVEALPGDLRRQVTSAAATTAEDVSLTLADGTLVRWGGPEQSDAKATALAALLEQLADGDLEPAATIDVSTPEAVVLR